MHVVVRIVRILVCVRILVLLQRKTLNETNNRTLKCLKWRCSTVRSMKNVAVLTQDGHLPSFFIHTPGDLTAQESPPLGICHPRQIKCQCPGSARKGGGKRGGWAQVELTDALTRHLKGCLISGCKCIIIS